MTDANGKRPVIALLGEFSAGKSTLVNALLGRSTSPVRVTATHVPPIWYSYGDQPPIQVLRDGEEVPLHSDDLNEVPMDGTRCIRLFLESEVLKTCDLLDMPGSSDPNMTPDIWDALLPQADGVVWCTPSTQAWRQSEAAIWEDVPEKLYATSLLMLTRIDKILGDKDRERLVTRIRRETSGLFRGVFPVSLLQAAAAEGDADQLRASGMAAFRQAFDRVLQELQNRPTDGEAGVDLAALRQARGGVDAREADDVAPAKASVLPFEPLDALDGEMAAVSDTAPEEAREPAGPVVIPRRVTRGAGTRSARPRRASGESSLI